MDLSEMLTIFSPPKPFQGRIDVIQRNAIESWVALGDEVEVMLVGDELGLADVAAEYGLGHIEDVARNKYGTPLLDDIFSKVRRAAANDLLCYVNADIIFLDDLIPSVRDIAHQVERFLVVGQRWDLEIEERLIFDDKFVPTMREFITALGCLHPPGGSDYFIYRRGEFNNLPPFALGRAGWDNWMIYDGIRKKIPVIDATSGITIVHQSHDYAHLPEGKPHYRLPETELNVELAGGREMIFTLNDASWTYEKKGLRKKSLLERGIPRWIETSVFTLLGPGKAAKIFRLLFHPISTLRYLYNKNVETSISSSGKF
jgi:hypothetical protein